ncbi:MAG TPA: nitroreductase family protein, partial [Candidatus Dormibacteraeota bacterium]|nr:nitroreductase family protein [Candidatus Dormibacteraeota bacterium]
MELSDILKKRRMVRRFSAEPVSHESLERIARAAQRAPSAGFSQGQRLIIVTDPALRLQLGQAADEDYYARWGWDHWVSSAPALFVPCISEQLYHERYQQPDKLEDGKEMVWPVPYWWIDVGCTVMLILLAAVDEGLAAGFAGPFPHPAAMNLLRSALRIPDHYTPVGIMPVGRPLADPPSPKLKALKVSPE